MRWPWTRTTTVRVGRPDLQPEPRQPHSTPSHHDRLLAGIAGEQPGWAVDVLSSVLRDIRDGHTLEPIAALDAWLEDETTFCLVYAPPDRDITYVGLRCRRGDLDPNHVLYRGQSPAELAKYANADDPDEYADDCITNISEPLGNIRGALRYDAGGVGWWGTLDDTLPTRPGSP